MMEIKLDIDKGKTLKVHWGIDTMAHGGLNDMDIGMPRDRHRMNAE